MSRATPPAQNAKITNRKPVKQKPYRRRGIHKHRTARERYYLLRSLLRLHPSVWRLFEITVLVVITNHTAIADLIQLLKLIKSW